MKYYQMIIIERRTQMYSHGCIAITPELAKRNPGNLISNTGTEPKALISLVEREDMNSQFEIIVDMETTPGEWGTR